MKRLVVFLLLAFSGAAFAQSPRIKSGSTVYIEPMDGYETYLAAAFAKKHVPLVVVTDKNEAEYLIRSTVSQQSPNQPAVVVNNSVNNNTAGPGAFLVQQSAIRQSQRSALYGETSASISIVDVHSAQVLFAYSVGKSRNTNQVQSTAEACAKHLKKFIEKSEKSKN